MNEESNSTNLEGKNATLSSNSTDTYTSVNGLLGASGAASLALVAVVANVILVLKIQVDTRHCRSSSSVSLVLTMVAVLGLTNGFTLGVLQICSFIFDRESMFTDEFCKIQGLASSLMSLFILWCQALLSFERHMKYVNPQEHSMTFSKLNMQVVVVGLFFMLLSAVAGPVYGWGKYTFLQELCVCSLDVRSENAVVYFAMATLTYVGTPYAVITYSYAGLAAHCLCPPRLSHTARSMSISKSSSRADLQRKSEALAAPGPLAVAAFLSLATQAPVVAIGLMMATDANYQPSLDPTYALFWLHNMGSCCGVAVCCLIHSACASGQICHCCSNGGVRLPVPASNSDGNPCLQAAWARLARRFLLVPCSTTVNLEMAYLGNPGKPGSNLVPAASCSVTVSSTYSDNNLCKL